MNRLPVILSDEELDALDALIARGLLTDRAEGLHEAIRAYLGTAVDGPVARSDYERAYGSCPDDPEIGEAGAHLVRELVEGGELSGGRSQSG